MMAEQDVEEFRSTLYQSLYSIAKALRKVSECHPTQQIVAHNLLSEFKVAISDLHTLQPAANDQFFFSTRVINTGWSHMNSSSMNAADTGTEILGHAEHFQSPHEQAVPKQHALVTQTGLDLSVPYEFQLHNEYVDELRIQCAAEEPLDCYDPNTSHYFDYALSGTQPLVTQHIHQLDDMLIMENTHRRNTSLVTPKHTCAPNLYRRPAISSRPKPYERVTRGRQQSRKQHRPGAIKLGCQLLFQATTFDQDSTLLSRVIQSFDNPSFSFNPSDVASIWNTIDALDETQSVLAIRRRILLYHFAAYRERLTAEVEKQRSDAGIEMRGSIQTLTGVGKPESEVLDILQREIYPGTQHDWKTLDIATWRANHNEKRKSIINRSRYAKGWYLAARRFGLAVLVLIPSPPNSGWQNNDFETLKDKEREKLFEEWEHSNSDILASYRSATRSMTAVCSDNRHNLQDFLKDLACSISVMQSQLEG